MNELEAMYAQAMQGQDPYAFPMDDPYAQAMQGQDPMLMQQMGMGADITTGYPQMGMSSQMLTQNMLGQPVPQVSQAEVEALAQALGLGGNNMVANGQVMDPMYARKYDVLSMLAGGV